MNIFIVCCGVIGYIRPNSVLVVCCGLLAKWFRVRVRVRVRFRVRAGAREWTSCPFFFSSGLISVVNTFVFVGSVVSVCTGYKFTRFETFTSSY